VLKILRSGGVSKREGVLRVISTLSSSQVFCASLSLGMVVGLLFGGFFWVVVAILQLLDGRSLTEAVKVFPRVWPSV